MRLVDIDKSIESVKNLIRNGATIEQALDAQPTVYDPEEVVKQLEEMKPDIECFDDAEDYKYALSRHNKYVEIVRNGGVK